MTDLPLRWLKIKKLFFQNRFILKPPFKKLTKTLFLYCIIHSIILVDYFSTSPLRNYDIIARKFRKKRSNLFILQIQTYSLQKQQHSYYIVRCLSYLWRTGWTLRSWAPSSWRAACSGTSPGKLPCNGRMHCISRNPADIIMCQSVKIKVKEPCTLFVISSVYLYLLTISPPYIAL